MIDSKLVKVAKLSSESTETNSVEESPHEIDDHDSESIVSKIVDANPELKLPSEDIKKERNDESPNSGDKDKSKPGYKPGDTIEFDF